LLDSSAPALNLIFFFAFIFSGSPVLGFLPVRAFVSKISNVPKPIKATLPPLVKLSVKASVNASKNALTSV